MKKNISVYIASFSMFFLFSKTSCNAQNNEDSFMNKHTRIIKNKIDATLLEPVNDNNLFCQLMKNVKLPPSLMFRDEENADITYFIQIFFSFNAFGKITFIKEKYGGSEQLKNVVSEIENNLKKITWKKNQVSSIYIFSCKISMVGLTNIYLSTEDNYMRKSYCD